MNRIAIGLCFAVGCTSGDTKTDSQSTASTAESPRTDTADPSPEDTGEAPVESHTFPDNPYEELREQGVDRYLGVYEPITRYPDGTGGTAHGFTGADSGPVCMYGGAFYTMTRDQSHEDLVIFLQGGGLCYSELCMAIGSGGRQFLDLDILSNDPEINPTASWNQVYVPYCDGSLFGGDVDTDEDGDGIPERRQRGLKNISAAIDVAHGEFPNPRRILLAGSSGGGYGTIIATMLVRWTWPDASLYVLNDSGVGLGIDGDPSFVHGIMDEFNALDLIPNSEPTLLDGGHLSAFIDWQLGQDPNLKVGAISHLTDYVISQMYLEVPFTDFEGWLRDETDRIQGNWPGRYEYFLPSGSQHTSLLGDPSGFVDPDDPYASIVSAVMGSMTETNIDDVTVSHWLEQLITDDESWASHAD